MKKSIRPENFDEYLEQYPIKVRSILKKLRQTIKKAAPDAEEVISYGMPAFKYYGMLVYFAAHKNHIGFYPFTTAIKTFTKELSGYEGAKGTVRFSYDKPVPYTLISKIIKFRVKENSVKFKNKKTKKK